jgi:hypothetical protein
MFRSVLKVRKEVRIEDDDEGKQTMEILEALGVVIDKQGKVLLKAS